MSKEKTKNKVFIALFLGILIILNFLVFSYCDFKNKDFYVSYDLVCDKNDGFELFYSKDGNWTEENSSKQQYTDINKNTEMSYSIPDDVSKIRIDLGNQNEHISISNIKLEYFGKKVSLDINKFYDGRNQESLGNVSVESNMLSIDINSIDPYLQYTLSDNEMNTLMLYKDKINNILKSFICIAMNILAFILIRKSKSVKNFIWELYSNRSLIWNLSKNDFKTKYAGSYLGIVWAFVQPVITIVVYWIVFQYGLKSGPQDKNIPFALWFITGLVPWFFFSEALINATNCMLEYSYLVKKIVFKINILPVVKTISSLFVHLVFIGFLILLFIIYMETGLYKGFDIRYLIQLLYYSFCTFVISLSISYITASVMVFFKDLGQIINIILQVGMWATPIMWNYTIIPAKYQWIVYTNPIFYIVDGYRDTLINNIWFVEKGIQTVYFWIITLVIFFIGTFMFKKLKPHFADVL